MSNISIPLSAYCSEQAEFVGGCTAVAILFITLPSLPVSITHTHLWPYSAKQTPQRPKFEFINESKNLPKTSVS